MINKRKWFHLIGLLLLIIVAVLLLRCCGGRGDDVRVEEPVTVERGAEEVVEGQEVEPAKPQAHEQIGFPDQTSVEKSEPSAVQSKEVEPIKPAKPVELQTIEDTLVLADTIPLLEAVRMMQPYEEYEVVKDTIFVRDTIVIERPVAVVTEPEEEASENRFAEDGNTGTGRTVMAVKTNLLYDLIATPNVELEFPLAKDRFSIAAEYQFPWFHARNDSWCHQMLYGGIEGRVWFGDRSMKPSLSGHFAGVYAGGGVFDFERNNKGYQCQGFFSAGLTYGYSFAIHKSLRIETSISAGYIGAKYEHYQAVEDGKFLVWQHDGKLSYFGPTKAKVSLVWTINSGGRGR